MAIVEGPPEAGILLAPGGVGGLQEQGIGGRGHTGGAGAWAEWEAGGEARGGVCGERGRPPRSALLGAA